MSILFFATSRFCDCIPVFANARKEGCGERPQTPQPGNTARAQNQSVVPIEGETPGCRCKAGMLPNASYAFKNSRSLAGGMPPVTRPWVWNLQCRPQTRAPGSGKRVHCKPTPFAHLRARHFDSSTTEGVKHRQYFAGSKFPTSPFRARAHLPVNSTYLASRLFASSRRALPAVS